MAVTVKLLDSPRGPSSEPDKGRDAEAVTPFLAHRIFETLAFVTAGSSQTKGYVDTRNTKIHTFQNC